jgi:hypothetical protein
VRRLNVPEIEDQRWCPASIRDGGTDWLRFMADTSKAFDRIAPKLERALRSSTQARVLDLCSGGGGPWLSLSKALPGIPVELSDLYPNLRAFETVAANSDGRIGFRKEPVNATDVPEELGGVRTLFNSFHHLPPELARAVLQDAVRKRQPIAIFEGMNHRGLGIASVLLQMPLIFLLTPFVRPWRWRRLALTYLLPAIPLLVLFDGTMSMLRLYMPDELRELVASLEGADTYDWDVGRTFTIIHLVGTPRSPSTQPNSTP